MDPPVLVDAVALGLEQRPLDGRVRPVEAAVAGDDPPPGEVGAGAEDVGDRLPAARAAQLLGQLAVADDVAGFEAGDGVEDLRLERGRLVVVGPRAGVGWRRVQDRDGTVGSMPGRHAVALSAAAAAVAALALVAPAHAGSQGYSYDCPPLEEPATVTFTGTAPASVQAGAAFSIDDGVISGSIELGQFSGLVNNGDQATISAPIVFGTTGDANVDGSVSVTVTLTKNGTTATFSQAIPSIAFTAGPDAATGVGFAPGNATVTAGSNDIQCTRLGTEGPFATTDVAGAGTGTTTPNPSQSPVRPGGATTSTTPVAAVTATTRAGGGALAETGSDETMVLVLAAGAAGATLAARQLSRAGRRPAR